MTKIETITGVEDELRAIALDYAQRGDPMGYFPALYLQVTSRVIAAIEEGRFDDPARMRRFDVFFAAHYFDALDRWRRDEKDPKIRKSWTKAFEEAQRPQAHTITLLLLGINAHVNVDLALSAAETSPDDIQSLRSDFERINDIFGAVIDDVLEVLGTDMDWVRAGDALGGGLDEAILHFNIVKARAEAWDNAVLLAGLSDEKRESVMRGLDQGARNLANLICAGSTLADVLKALIRPARWDAKRRLHVTGRIEALLDFQDRGGAPK
jgi:hypothetical protein